MGLRALLGETEGFAGGRGGLFHLPVVHLDVGEACEQGCAALGGVAEKPTEADGVPQVE